MVPETAPLPQPSRPRGFSAAARLVATYWEKAGGLSVSRGRRPAHLLRVFGNRPGRTVVVRLEWIAPAEGRCRADFSRLADG